MSHFRSFIIFLHSKHELSFPSAHSAIQVRFPNPFHPLSTAIQSRLDRHFDSTGFHLALSLDLFRSDYSELRRINLFDFEFIEVVVVVAFVKRPAFTFELTAKFFTQFLFELQWVAS